MGSCVLWSWNCLCRTLELGVDNFPIQLVVKINAAALTVKLD